MEGFLGHIDAAYASTEGGFFAHADLRLSDRDPDGTRITGRWGYGSEYDGDSLVITGRPVGGRNAGAFQGWVTVSKADLRRIQAARPSGWHSYTVMVGFAPDDETIWWSAVYDDDALAVAPWEEMDGGRWFRLAPEFAAEARKAEANMLQQTLGLSEGETPPPGPAVRETVLDVIQSGLSLLLDDEEMKHLTLANVRSVRARMPRVIANLDKWYDVRIAQSRSGSTSALRR